MLHEAWVWWSKPDWQNGSEITGKWYGNIVLLHLYLKSRFSLVRYNWPQVWLLFRRFFAWLYLKHEILLVRSNCTMVSVPDRMIFFNSGTIKRESYRNPYVLNGFCTRKIENTYLRYKTSIFFFHWLSWEIKFDKLSFTIFTGAGQVFDVPKLHSGT